MDIKGKLVGIVVSIFLLAWKVPRCYYRYEFMIDHDYEIYMIWNEIGGYIFFSVFAVGFFILIGHIVDILLGNIKNV